MQNRSDGTADCYSCEHTRARLRSANERWWSDEWHAAVYTHTCTLTYGATMAEWWDTAWDGKCVLRAICMRMSPWLAVFAYVQIIFGLYLFLLSHNNALRIIHSRMMHITRAQAHRRSPVGQPAVKVVVVVAFCGSLGPNLIITFPYFLFFNFVFFLSFFSGLQFTHTELCFRARTDTHAHSWVDRIRHDFRWTVCDMGPFIHFNSRWSASWWSKKGIFFQCYFV